MKYARLSVKKQNKNCPSTKIILILHTFVKVEYTCHGGIHFCHGGIHFCQGGIQKALFRLARLCNLCSKHGHPLQVRSPKRVALPMLHVK